MPPKKVITMKRLKQFIRDDEAASAVEYGFLLVGVALAIALSITLLGQAVSNIFTTASTLF